ncbi:MAG: rod shape-determining protein RodA [Helicobacteraceae bacterium]|nr:rod shape-determining protein RodA [Helicobacteraceae bacterium]
MFNVNRRVIAHFDYLIILTTLPIILISLKLIYEVNPSLTIKQIIYISITIFISLVIFLIPIKRFFWLIPFYYWMTIILLVLVEFFGVTKFGAQRWIEIPFIGISLQPSEFAKSALILMLAYNISNDPPTKDGYKLKGFLKHSFFILLPVVLVKIQPDLGTSILIFIMGYGVLFLVGIHKKILITIASIIAIMLIAIPIIKPIINNYLHTYQLNRIEQFLSSKPQYQVQQSMIAIGSGGFFGKEIENTTQAQLNFLPVPESDFIFSYLMERFGFLGALVVLFLYGLLILHLFILSYTNRKNRILQVLSASIGFLLFIHVSVNVLMTIKLAPVVGIPLPFLSYGGSSFLTFGILFALLQNLLAFRFVFEYNSTPFAK